MNDRDKLDPDSLFTDDETGGNTDLDSLFGDSPPDPKPEPETIIKKKRSAKDFQPDMDALLLSAQSLSMVEAIRNFTAGNFFPGNLSAYSEAIKGTELCVKIIQRNPEGYGKISKIMNADPDFTEVENTSFNLYKAAHKSLPGTDAKKARAYQYFYAELLTAYKKCLIAKSMDDIKFYFLISGGLNVERLKELISSNDPGLQKDIVEFDKSLRSAVDLVNKGKSEIKKHHRGKDTNHYIVKASELLYFYYASIGGKNACEYYKRINENFTRYKLIK